jgi:hypothetical protein
MEGGASLVSSCGTIQEFSKYVNVKVCFNLFAKVKNSIGFIRLRNLGPFRGAEVINAIAFSYWIRDLSRSKDFC